MWSCKMLFFYFLDIDEWTTGSHACSAYAVCTNTKGSYNCTCNPGYYGDGRNCERGKWKLILQFDFKRKTSKAYKKIRITEIDSFLIFRKALLDQYDDPFFIAIRHLNSVVTASWQYLKKPSCWEILCFGVWLADFQREKSRSATTLSGGGGRVGKGERGWRSNLPLPYPTLSSHTSPSQLFCTLRSSVSYNDIFKIGFRLSVTGYS